MKRELEHRTVSLKIDSMLFERTALAEDRLTPDMILKDPYIREGQSLKGAK